MNKVNNIILKDSVKSTEEEVFEKALSEDIVWLFCDISDFKNLSAKK